MDTKLLESIGLTEGETKVYLALLKLGETKTGPLAKEAEVSSSKVYKILDRLIKKGLAGHVTKGKILYFSAVEPKRILEYMDNKERELKEKREQVLKLIPQLEVQQKNTIIPKAVVLEGFKAITNFFSTIPDLTGIGNPYYVIGASYGKDYPGAKEFFYKYHRERVKKKVKVKMLANYETKGTIEKTTYKNAEIRYLPQYFISNIQITFFKDKVFFIIWESLPIGLLVNSEEAVKSFKSYFDTLWKIAKK